MPLLVGGSEFIGISGTATFTQNCGTNAIFGNSSIKVPSGLWGPAYNNMSGALLLGWYGGFTRNAGYYGNGVGTYNLNGGLLTGSSTSNATNLNGLEAIGMAGTGIFNQTGGTNIATSILYVGGAPSNSTAFLKQYYSLPGNNPAYGTYSLSGGSLSGLGGEYVGTAGTGIFTQTAGTNVTTTISLAGNTTMGKASNNTTVNVSTPGTFNLEGGLLQVGSIVRYYAAPV